MSALLAVDPGREKCGVALLAETGEIICRRVVAAETLTAELKNIVGEFSPERLVIGNGTSAAAAVEKIKRELPDLAVTVCDEYCTTDEAKKLYWEISPPTGWRKFLPVTMQSPPVPVDDLAAVVLARRYLATSGDNGGVRRKGKAL